MLTFSISGCVVDLECDALGWQYISGGMADAHPFSFIIDLTSECARLDPDGEYVRRWLPALALLPTEYIHAPWTAPPAVRRGSPAPPMAVSSPPRN